jgi:undecaprenyl-diphosphatase
MLNDNIFFFFYNLTHKSLFLDKLFVFIADIFPYIVILLVGIFLLFHHEVLSYKHRFNNEAIWDSFRILKQKWREIVLVFFSGIFAWCIATLVKIIIQAPRPFLVFGDIVPLLQPTDYSFPSGHSTFFMALAVAVFLCHKKAGYYFIFFALLIGISRIIVGVHFPIDILVGFILGTIIAYLVRVIYDKIFKK